MEYRKKHHEFFSETRTLSKICILLFILWTQVKSQIHTSISRHLETLRNREVWLLGQVDTVLGGKEEVLHRQQARLNKALGVLHSGLTHATSCDDETAAKHLVHALEE